MALKLEYDFLRRTALYETILLLLWVVYSFLMLNLAVSIIATVIISGFVLHNLKRYIGSKEEIKKLSQSHAYTKTSDELARNIVKHPDRVHLGRGFVWEASHVQGYNDLLKLPERRKVVDLETKGGGYEFMHGLNSKGDKEINVRPDQLQHTLIAGTTGTGKTKFFELLISQLCAHEPMVIVDPKGDKGLLDGVYDACVDHGIEDRFVFFSLAHPSKSVGFNPLSNYGQPSDVADRVASIMPAGSGDAAFKNFAWQVIEVVSSALMGIQEDITLERLQDYSMHNMSELVDWCKQVLPTLRSDLYGYAEESTRRLEAQAHHPREHHQKMITSLGPVLTSLNTGDVAPLLNSSPSKSLQWSDVFENNKVVYFDLSSMLRQEVSNNVGKMIVQDLLYFIGELYAFKNSNKAMNLFVDEFYSVMFDGYIDMLNKSRGAGLKMFLGMQTTADIANALGDGKESYVRQVLGNINNKIYLRVPEYNLAEEFCSLFGSTYITQIDEVHVESSSAGTPSELFGSNTARRKSHVEANIVSPDMLMHLPIGQAFAFLEARDPYKLRLPLIDRPEEKKNHFSDKIMQSGMGRIDVSDIRPWADMDESKVEWPDQD